MSTPEILKLWNLLLWAPAQITLGARALRFQTVHAKGLLMSSGTLHNHSPVSWKCIIFDTSSRLTVIATDCHQYMGHKKLPTHSFCLLRRSKDHLGCLLILCLLEFLRCFNPIISVYEWFLFKLGEWIFTLTIQT